MKQTILYVLLAICLIACNPKGVDFTYYPTAPKAGETVEFSNLTHEGEHWLWMFGDGTKSLARNPSKIYKKAGTYVVSLMVDSVKWKTIAKEIMVYDTMPSFVLKDDSTIYYMQEVTFEALVYNPYSYDISYEWIVPQAAVVTSADNISEKLKCYFTEHSKEQEITLKINFNGVEKVITKSFMIEDNPAPMMLYKQSDGTMWQQRIYDLGMEEPNQLPTTASEAISILNQAIDTIALFNGVTFSASTMAQIGSVQPKGLDIDPIMRKIYVRSDKGLAICNMNMSNAVDILSTPVNFIKVDNESNNLFYATPTGVYSLRLIQTTNNIAPIDTVAINKLTDVVAISIFK